MTLGPSAPLPIVPTSTQGDSAAEQLTASLLTEISQLPNQPTSLPPSFVTAFARKCFTSELSSVDFSQALTGLDYLRDLEMRRRREMQAALTRLQITPEETQNIEHELSREYPGALDWYRTIEMKERRIETLYTQIYIGLRRWILINEMSLRPFNRHNCLAMLNTLYPPLQTVQPTTQVTMAVQQQLRTNFFRMITEVEKNGTRSLVDLIKQGKQQHEIDGWAAVRESLDKYLQVANSMISECTEVLDIKDPARLTSAPGAAGRRKVDSGIDILTASRKSSVCSANSRNSAYGSLLGPEAASTNEHTPGLRATYKSTTTLEKIAREFKYMTRSKPDICEIISTAPPVPQGSSFEEQVPVKPSGLRKMRSLSALNIKRANSRDTASSRPETPTYDADEMRQQRMLYEAHASKSPLPIAAAH